MAELCNWISYNIEILIVVSKRYICSGGIFTCKMNRFSLNSLWNRLRKSIDKKVSYSRTLEPYCCSSCGCLAYWKMLGYYVVQPESDWLKSSLLLVFFLNYLYNDITTCICPQYVLNCYNSVIKSNCWGQRNPTPNQ